MPSEQSTATRSGAASVFPVFPAWAFNQAT